MTRSAIETVVFPVAGLGTRFLPATKASPKEMLPIVDKPLIQYAVEEAIAAGARTLVFVTGRTKRALEDHFDMAYELETELAQRGKQDLLDTVRGVLPEGIHCVYVRQREALGLGHAVLCARPLVGDKPFGVILADDLIEAGDRPVMMQLAERYAATGRSVISVEAVEPSRTQHYGVVDIEAESGERFHSVRGIVEKPAPEDAPSNLAVVGRYILTPRIFQLLETTAPDHRGEIQLTDAIASLIDEQGVDCLEFEGTHYDCGSKLGYLRATVDYALNHPELGADFAAFLRDREVSA
ncbi:UTP--glucose-1-phosphate uridylyltransferase GalU [Wenzhouxiangella sp. XN79A]|uniref:UTP--glucose-1-phosphate uridylyltransferase GalU n=1 Tax=Wenzhouxiangella sp. XN79A TaxID=2724193 RepID=UPI00144AB2DD|nr:UTP--glucose-1-phosphate uridylyltransferase GalU [Wenzhouxiangella sp. XN79A]NKI34110.1 UTP--glucose-1-phosphate uridylyltransferase GalU [Wenzhouxiangella sp. XN79A]